MEQVIANDVDPRPELPVGYWGTMPVQVTPFRSPFWCVHGLCFSFVVVCRDRSECGIVLRDGRYILSRCCRPPSSSQVSRIQSVSRDREVSIPETIPVERPVQRVRERERLRSTSVLSNFLVRLVCLVNCLSV